MKKQTAVEELAKEFYSEENQIMERIAFKRGYTECKEIMFSEEDLHKAYCAGSDFDMSCLKGEQYYMFKEWFEQFKKKYQ